MPNPTVNLFQVPMAATSKTLPTVSKRFSMVSIFSDNSRVCYKQGSLPSCGIGSVRNSSIKSNRI